MIPYLFYSIKANYDVKLMQQQKRQPETWLAHNLHMTCTWLAHDLQKTCTWIATSCKWLVYDLHLVEHEFQ